MKGSLDGAEFYLPYTRTGQNNGSRVALIALLASLGYGTESLWTHLLHIAITYTGAPTPNPGTRPKAL